MPRRVTPPRRKVEAKRSQSAQSPKSESSSRIRELEKRVAESLQREKSTSEILDEKTRALTEAWDHGTQAHTWFFFTRRDGKIQSVTQEGQPAPR